MMINGNKNSFLQRIGSGFVEYERLKRKQAETEKYWLERRKKNEIKLFEK